VASAPGGRANEPPCVAQIGQCSWERDCCVSWLKESPWSLPTFTNLAPPTLQTSTQAWPRAAATAWEIDGANAANRIAKHAIKAAKRRVINSIPMAKLYQPPTPFASARRRGTRVKWLGNARQMAGERAPNGWGTCAKWMGNLRKDSERWKCLLLRTQKCQKEVCAERQRLLCESTNFSGTIFVGFYGELTAGLKLKLRSC
jgi:hypothetical protein